MTAPVGRVVQQLRHLLEGEGRAGLRDAELLQRFLARRDEEAFAGLVGRHGPLVLGVCRRVLGNVHDAEDAFQATFLVLARRPALLRRPASLAAWLYGIALRVARHMKREASKRRQRTRQVTPAPPTAPPDPGWQELQTVLDEEVQRLPENNRQPLLLCYFEGLTQEEAAQQLGWPRGTLKRRLERGRELLKGRLTRRGLSLAATLVASWPAGEALAAGVPATLGAATVQAAVPFAVRRTVDAALAAAHVVALAEGVLKTMLIAKLKILTALVVILGLAALGALVYAGTDVSPGGEPIAQAPGANAAVAQGGPSAPVKQPQPAGQQAAPAVKDIPLGESWHFEYSGQAAPLHLVLRSQEAWEVAWAVAHRPVDPPPVPKVDFTKHMVLAVFLGTRPTGGYRAGIAGVVESSATWTVTVRETRPGPDQFVPQAETRPCLLVVVPRFEGKVVFRNAEAAADGKKQVKAAPLTKERKFLLDYIITEVDGRKGDTLPDTAMTLEQARGLARLGDDYALAFEYKGWFFFFQVGFNGEPDVWRQVVLVRSGTNRVYRWKETW
jgi:RNA polymerase sigma factor (sigma-70 family)